MNPVVVHVVRPYATEQEYLAAEAWTIDARSMLLVDAEPLPPETAVLFDIALADGQKPIRAEGRVVAMVQPIGERPGGMKVRFKRFGAATKAFIERAVKARAAEAPSRPEGEAPSASDGERISLPEVRASMTDLEAVVPPPPPRESGVRERVPGPIAPPANRDELLNRLRQRRRAS